MNNLTQHLATGVLAAAAVGGLALAASAPANALAKTATTVTIQANGTDLSGTVSSSDASCVADRKVIVIKQIGTRGGGDDIRFASDTADSDGDWNTGNTGTEGFFYAKVRATTTCARDLSPTIQAVR